MKVYIDASEHVRAWKHVERYQNTTLRYSPGEDFPAFLENEIGELEIIRLFITLDEVWDYRTDTYHWDYLIGTNLYEGDKNHYDYDWPLTVPSVTGTREMAYLTSHASCAKKVLLNIRRYEREVFDGVITLDKYAEVVSNVIEHYKKIIPNIVYIEVCNEVELPQFGNLTIPQYYQLYKAAEKAITELNQKHSYDLPLQTGGFGMACGMWHISIWREFLVQLANDPDRKIDFYSFHEYHGNPYRVMELYMRHEELIHELNLPDLPIFMTEYGMRYGLGDAGRPNTLQNASGEIPGMIIGSHCKNMAMFPWCTFHNPNQQPGRTMYIQLTDGRYTATPSGHVMKFFSMLGNQECESSYYNENRSVATADDSNTLSLLISNPQSDKECYHIRIQGLKKTRYRICFYLVDQEHNNVLANPEQNTLQITHEFTQDLDGTYEEDLWMQPTSVCFYQFIPEAL